MEKINIEDLKSALSWLFENSFSEEDTNKFNSVLKDFSDLAYKEREAVLKILSYLLQEGIDFNDLNIYGILKL